MAIKTILAEQPPLSFDYDSSIGAFVHHSQTIYLFLNEGETYQVVWKGETFPCIAFSAGGSVNLGNPIAFGGEDNSVPFLIACNPEHGGTSIFSFEPGTDCTLAIYQEVESSETESGVSLYDHGGNTDTYDIGKGIRLFKADGTVQDFFPGNAEELIVDLNFSDGDMVIESPEGVMYEKVSIPKPANLIPENIAEGAEIAGVVGTLKGVGGLDEGFLKYFAFNANYETRIITIYAILYDRIYEATGSYDVTIPDEILGYKVQLMINP